MSARCERARSRSGMRALVDWRTLAGLWIALAGVLPPFPAAAGSAATAGPGAAGAAAASPGAALPCAEVEKLRGEVEALRRRDEENRARMMALEATVRRLVDAQAPAGAGPARPAAASASPADALDRALSGGAAVASPPPASPPSPGDALDKALASGPSPGGASSPTVTATSGAKGGDVWSAPIAGGAAQARLIDTSFSTLLAGGGSSVGNFALGQLEGGGHDPNENGFTLQQAELSFSGAVDPYFTGEAHIVGTTHGVELEEAFFTTSALPFGLQVEAGYSLTEFGLMNPLHAHAWDWMDQPVINTRMFGGDGMRSPGARVGWLLPTPFFSELHLGVQDANEGEFTPSFIGEEAVGGRPSLPHDIRSFGDMLWLLRSNSSWDLGPEAALLLGFSGLHGPNQTGPDGGTWIYGVDAKIRWRPQDNFRGWPFVVWQAEFMRRDYKADAFTAGTDIDPASGEYPNNLPGDTLHDQGFYTQLLYGFRYGWAAGLRAEYATGSGQDVDGGVLAPREMDALRDNRVRISPLLVWHPTEFSRLRLQYNYDSADHLNGGDAHTIWIGAEVLYGKHGAHKY